MLSNLKYALRQLRQNPGFTVAAVLSLGLGIGANTAIFSLVNELLLKALPVHRPEELVRFRWNPVNGQPPMHDLYSNAGGPDGQGSFPLAAYERLRMTSAAPVEIFAFGGLPEANVSAGGRAEIVEGAQLVSGTYFSILGIQPLLGRMIAPDDDQAGASPVAVVSYRYWQQHLDGRTDAIGKTLQVNGVPAVMIGVTPPGFLGVAGADSPRDISLPLALWSKVGSFRAYRPDQKWSNWWLCVMGRLKSGATIEAAQASLAGGFAQSIREIYANMSRPPQELHLPELEVTSAARVGYQNSFYRESLLVLMALAGLVLLIACCNVANLLLARGAARRKEIAVRLGLGASRGRVVRQLLTESVLLAGLGGTLGLLVAQWTKSFLFQVHPVGQSAMTLDPKLNPAVIAFACAVSLVTSIIFGVLPALRATRLNLNVDLQGSAGGTSSRSAFRPGRCLMIGQICLSVVLLVGAGLFLRTLVRLQNIDAGFNRHHLLLFRVDGSRLGYSPERFATVAGRIAERLRQLPGSPVAAFSDVPILSGSEHGEDVTVIGQASLPRAKVDVPENTVSAGFFDTFGVSMVLGREFDSRDRFRNPGVLVINQTMAKMYFGGENPIGRRVDPIGTVIGVAQDMKYMDLEEPMRPTMFRCFSQQPARGAEFVVRSTQDPRTLIQSVRETIHAIEPGLAPADIRTQDEQVDNLYGRETAIARSSGFFGLLSLALVCTGLYGLMSYTVLRRTGEIGIRMAVGAPPARIVRMVLRESFVLAGIGIIAGTVGAAAASHIVSSMLFGVSTIDPLTYAGVIALLLSITLVAALLPARRAAHVDPVVALRAE